MPYGNQTTVIPSVDITESPVDGQPYWFRVRSKMKAREVGLFSTVGQGYRDWIEGGGKPADMPEAIGDLFAGLILDWNFDGMDGQKLAITPDAIRDVLLQEDLQSIDALYKPAAERTGKDAADFTPPSTPGSKDEGQPPAPISPDSVPTSTSLGS